MNPADSGINEVKRLYSVDDVRGRVTVPAYDPAAHGNGIVHLGVGAFHRAHQAVYTDEAIGQAGGDWRIIGVSLQASDIADALNRRMASIHRLGERLPVREAV